MVFLYNLYTDFNCDIFINQKLFNFSSEFTKMAGSFKYRLGFNELSSRKHRLWNSLVAEFVGKFN